MIETLISLSLVLKLLSQTLTAFAAQHNVPIMSNSAITGTIISERYPSTDIKQTSPTIAYTLIPAILQRIAFCESGGKQFDENGNVIRSKTNDIGKYQINLMHYEEAKKLGLDIYKEPDNEAFAIELWNRNGTRDWSASAKCWNG